jgi:type IV pilus assembly protein PilO
MNIKVIKEIISVQSKAIILIGGLLFVNLCLYLYTFAYQMPRIERFQSNWFQMRKSSSAGSVQESFAVYQQGERDLKVWRERILPKKNFARFVGSLFQTAANNHLEFQGISYKVTQFKDENLSAYVMDFDVTGKYASVKSFISDIGLMREMVTIDNISLTNSKATVDSVSLKVQMTVYLRVGEQ